MKNYLQSPIVVFTLILLLGYTTVTAQKQITITFSDVPSSGTYSQINAYLLSNYLGTQNLVDSAVVKNTNKLRIDVPQNQNKALFTLMLYANINGKSVQSKMDFLYAGNNIVFNTAIGTPQDSMQVIQSETNRKWLYYQKKKKYLSAYFTDLQQLQQLTPPKDSFTTAINTQTLKVLQQQKQFFDSIRTDTNHSVASKYIRWLQMSEIYTNELANKQLLKQTFLQRFDFSDPLLKTGDLLTRIVNSYLFLFKDDKLTFEQQQDTLIKAIDNLMNYCYADDEIAQYVAKTLTKDFRQIGMDKLVLHLTEDYLLTTTCSNPEAEEKLKAEVQRMESVQIGKKAPNFEINKNGIDKLYSISAPQTVIIFWATWCSHCQQTLPQIYDILSAYPDTKVVAIALDDNTEQWKNVSKKYKDWIHLQANDMWDDDLVQLYAVYATPTLYVLDSAFTIVGKPKTANELGKIIENKSR